MSYPQPPQWGPQGYYPPPTPPPQKSNTGKTLLLLVLGGMCVICTVPVVLSKPFRDGFREENERLNRVANGEQEEPQATRTAPPDGGTMAPLEPAQVSPAAPPDDSDLVDFPDNRRRRSDDSLANIPTAIGHLESPAPPGSTPQPEVATRLREALCRALCRARETSAVPDVVRAVGGRRTRRVTRRERCMVGTRSNDDSKVGCDGEACSAQPLQRRSVRDGLRARRRGGER